MPFHVHRGRYTLVLYLVETCLEHWEFYGRREADCTSICTHEWPANMCGNPWNRLWADCRPAIVLSVSRE